jgi:lysine-N-methylase
MPSATTLRYATRFQCIGGACEDNCCAHPWNIAVDRPDFVRLKRAMSSTPGSRTEFEHGCVRGSDVSPPARSYASLQRRPAGECVFLTADRLCSIHATHGPTALPRVCATYPRFLSRIGRRLSVTDTLSCPEAARLGLLADDAVLPESVDARELAALKVRQVVPAGSRDPFVRNYFAIRSAFLDVLAMGEYPMASRFYIAARLARRLDSVRKASGQGATAPRLLAAISACRSAATLARWDRERRTNGVSGAAPFLLVQQVLLAVPRTPATARFTALVDAVQGPWLEPRPGGDGYDLRGGALWEAYRASRARWEDEFPDRIARYIAHYAANYWMRDPFTVSPDLLTHLLRLLARVAVIRFLLFAHPALGDEGGPHDTRERRQEALDRAIVEVVYLFSRAVEHADTMLELLHEVMALHGMRGTGRVAEFAGF